MNHNRIAFLSLLVALLMILAGSRAATADDTKPSTLLTDMFSWWNSVINSDEPLTADQFRRYFTEDGVILVNNREQVRGVEHMPEHFQAIRERPGTIEIELPFIEEFQSGNKIFTYHRIISKQESGEQVTHNMGYAILDGDRIAIVSLARFQEEPQK